MKGQIISGEFGKIVMRQKSDQNVELGELLVADTKDGKVLLQVYDLQYASQLSQENLELVSGMNLEENTDTEFMDPHLRNYNLALLKSLIAIKRNKAAVCKSLPNFFANVWDIGKDDLKFITNPENPLFIGKLRSGSKELDVDICLDGVKAFTHHILIPATTGRGKSNLTSCILWNSVDQDYCGLLVLDPHDEYYGRDKVGLKDHPRKEKVVYYTPRDPPPGAKNLKINLMNIKPEHFNGVVEWTQPQKEALNSYYREYGDRWIENIILEKPLKVDFNPATISVLKRRMLILLDLDLANNKLYCNGIFDIQAGQTTISDICQELEKSKIVIIDTSGFSGSVEILVGSLVANELFHRYKNYNRTGSLKDKPVISIILEEAPRVLGKEVLEKGSNIFSTIAREGRKFKVGLTAITQLPSLIPREILANMNTKIILGIEMAPERQAIIESASQDLSNDSRNIASLDMGEAIITSNFAKFAMPVKIPLFSDMVKNYQNKYIAEKYKKDFGGVNLK